MWPLQLPPRPYSHLHQHSGPTLYPIALPVHCTKLTADISASTPPYTTSVQVWCGVVWCGVVWCGVVWCGVVWYGVLVTPSPPVRCTQQWLCFAGVVVKMGFHPHCCVGGRSLQLGGVGATASPGRSSYSRMAWTAKSGTPVKTSSPGQVGQVSGQSNSNRAGRDGDRKPVALLTHAKDTMRERECEKMGHVIWPKFCKTVVWDVGLGWGLGWGLGVMAKNILWSRSGLQVCVVRVRACG